MEEDKTRIKEEESKSLEEVMRERQRLDRLLQDKFRKRMAILFSDVCGFTQYTATRGDISGRAWIQQHHDIVFPCIEGNEGKILDIMGDGVMASFPSSLSAVKAAVAIQKSLDEYNAKTDPADSIHVRIGINAGEILVDDRKVAGDVVNVASRLQTQAGADQILVSKTVYDDVCGSEDILCRCHGQVKLKGKAEPSDVYRVVWRDEDALVSLEPRVRLREAERDKPAPKPYETFQLELTREDGRLKISAHEQIAGEEIAIRHYEEIPVSMERIDGRCREIVETLNKANRRGRISRDILVKLRESGQVLHDELFSLNVKRKLMKTRAEYLVLNIDDHLVHVPWELLHDGQQFLCQRFNMGRLVKTRQAILGVKPRLLAWPLRMLILADPEGDLKGAYTEGIQIRDFLDRHKDLINVVLRTGQITPDSVKEKLRNFDFTHFAGHADYDQGNPSASGWRLTTGNLKAEDIGKMAGTGSMPALIFSNACQSARTEEWILKEHFQNEIFGLANAFLLAGVRHYIGTFWEVLDEPSSRFALEFYKGLLSGMAIGEAVRVARQALIREYSEETIVWASYILYGDPTFNYLAQVEVTRSEEEPRRAHAPLTAAEVRAREEVIDLAMPGAPKRRRPWWAVAAGILMALGVLFGGYQVFSQRQIARYEREALALYNQGNFEEALNLSGLLEEKRPHASLGYLIQGNIHLRKGSIERAEAAYQKALQATDGSGVQKAEAFVGLGRIASLRKQPKESLTYYRQATEAAPQSTEGYLSQALLLEGQGDYGEALVLLLKAQKLAPQDRTVTALAKTVQERLALAQDQEKQARIDRTIKELLGSMKAPPRALPSDGWTSFPLTLWVMDFETRGFPLREGEERLLVSGIVDQVLGHNRVQVVERALLDKLLSELKLGTSNLTERSTALQVGKILAARLILSGQLVYAEPLTQVSMRLIETETGRIVATVNESYGSAVPASELADRLAKRLLERLEELYPLRGKISELSVQGVKLNIGREAGVTRGQVFKVVNQDVILTVMSIQPETSIASVSKGEGRLVEGLRVEAVHAAASQKSET